MSGILTFDGWKIALVALVWTSLAAALATGYVYTPNYRTRRSDDPKLYWTSMSAGAVAATIITLLLLRG